jgi:hypothetical protein
MVSPDANILILFALAAALAFFFILVRDQAYKHLDFKSAGKALVPLLPVLAPFAALYGLMAFLGGSIQLTLPCFAGAAVLYMLLARLGFTPQARGVLLTAAAVPLAMNLPADGGNLSICATIMGILVAKVTDSLLLGNDRSLEDLAAPVSWLAGVLWLSTFADQSHIAVRQGLLLGVISVCFILRVMQRPFMTDDRWLLKRLILSCSGGLAALIVITKLLLAPSLAPIALLVGVGLFATYLFQNFHVGSEKEKPSAVAGMKLLIVIGMLTLVATRFWGIYGLVLLAPLSIVASRFSLAQFGGVYFVSRILAQVFVSLYNDNVTGINVTHAYVGAAQYAGFISIAAVALLLREFSNRRLVTAIYLGAAALVPVACNYYLHVEAASSFLVAATAAGVIFAVLAPAFAPDQPKIQFESLLLMPALMSTIGIAYGALLQTGENAANAQRTIVLACALGATILGLAIGWFAKRQKNKASAISG